MDEKNEAWQPAASITGTDPESHNWIYLGNKNIQDGTRRIAIPEGVFDEGLFERPDESGEYKVHWSYENGSGLTIISDQELTDRPMYKHIGSTSQGGPVNNYAATIPADFFDDSQGRTVADERVEEHARLQYGEERHFLTRQEFLEAEKKSCYLLNRAQLTNIIGSYRDLHRSVASVPSFLSE